VTDYYLIHGKESSRDYLVLADDGLRLLHPGQYTLPWVGDGGHQHGLSVTAGAGQTFTGPMWLAALRVRGAVARHERSRRRERERRERASRYAARRAAAD
jgi:hypothetical protein